MDERSERKETTMVTAKILVNCYDGTRQLFPADSNVLLTVTDGNKRTVFRNTVKGPTIIVEVPFHDNFDDQYTVLASPDNGLDAGFFPVNVSPNLVRPVFLMFLPKEQESQFNFASWQDLQQRAPDVSDLVAASDAGKAQQRYEGLVEKTPKSLACLLNILTACRDILLPERTVLEYFKQLVWDSEQFPMLQDRFYVWADPDLVTQVRLANAQGAFAEEPNPGLLHKGATTSYKQIAFGEANVQLTFHENESSPTGTNWVLVEPDIDYFKDMAAHFFLEVIPGFFGLTDPRTVYVLRWIAGHQANMPEFNPPYTIRSIA
jgi:hypothetical protein